MSYKSLYIFKDPMGADESKIGVTKKDDVRLGSYQNSYSKKSHTACFDVVYYGPEAAIDRLERIAKKEFDWQIELDGRGHSEWVSENYLEIEAKIDELIKNYKFKIKKLPKRFLPLTVDNLPEARAYIAEQLNKELVS